MHGLPLLHVLEHPLLPQAHLLDILRVSQHQEEHIDRGRQFVGFLPLRPQLQQSFGLFRAAVEHAEVVVGF